MLALAFLLRTWPTLPMTIKQDSQNFVRSLSADFLTRKGESLCEPDESQICQNGRMPVGSILGHCDAVQTAP